MIQLRSYQSRDVDAIRAAFRSGLKSIAYVAPTGSGKTRILTYIAFGAIAKSNRITILVHRQELVRQTAAALTDMGVAYGLITARGEAAPNCPVQLAMVQTLARRLDFSPSPDLLIIDEFHHGVSESYLQVMQRYPSAKILGLTATPQRLDGKGLASICQQLVIGPTVQELIDQGFLSRPIYYAPPTDLDMNCVKRTAGDFNKKETAERVDRPKITGSAVEHYSKICPGAPAVAFCASVKHAENVRDQFIAAGYRAASIDGSLSDEDRVDRVASLADGRINILTSVDVISEGFDLPSVTAGIMLRPTESLALHLQQIGRVLRPAPGKTAAIILDHVGNCMRHGLAEEPREWSLASRERKKKSASNDPTLVTCPDCFVVHPPAPKCPKCNHVYPPRHRLIGEVDGQLAVLTAQAILADRQKAIERSRVGMAKTKDQLEAIAKERGYKPAWVAMMMRVRTRKKWKEQIATTHEATAQKTLPL